MHSHNSSDENRASAQSSNDEAAEKQRSEFIASRHYLTGQVTVQPEHEMQAFESFIREMVEAFAPANIIERQLAQSYATYQWRINRSAAIEETMFTLGNIEQVAENLNIQHAQAHNAASKAKTFREGVADFAQITLYSQRLVQQSEIVLRRLQQLQAERKQLQENDMAEATRFYMLHAMHHADFDPQAHGFQTTLDQIRTSIRRRTLQVQAAVAEKLNWNLGAFTQKGGSFAA